MNFAEDLADEHEQGYLRGVREERDRLCKEVEIMRDASLADLNSLQASVFNAGRVHAFQDVLARLNEPERTEKR